MVGVSQVAAVVMEDTPGGFLGFAFRRTEEGSHVQGKFKMPLLVIK